VVQSDQKWRKDTLWKKGWTDDLSRSLPTWVILWVYEK